MSAVAPATPPASAQEPVVRAVTKFTESVTAALLSGGGAAGPNLVVSPYSVATALGMTVNGARGRTAEQMLTVLGGLSVADLDAGLALLDRALVSRSRVHQLPDGKQAEVVAAVANSVWGQRGVTWEPDFLDALARWFGAGMRLVDYGNTEAARQAINGWVKDRTRSRIPQLLAPGVLDADTRLVLVNALYLKAPWLTPFEPQVTVDGPFRTDSGATVTAPLMSGPVEGALTARDPAWTAVTMPYVGRELAMTVVLPEQPDAAAHRTLIAQGLIGRVLSSVAPGAAAVTMPRFTIRAQAELSTVLAALGMPAAFAAEADFSGMTRQAKLAISAVVHEAFVAVDEAGTEAAAATAVVMREVSAPLDPVQLRLDRPFLFVIHEVATRTPLFVGRVGDPTR